MRNNSKTSMAMASALGLLLLSSAGQALDLTASSSNPSVFFEDSTTNDGQDWAIIAHEAPAGSGEYLVLDRLGTNNNVIFRISGSSGSSNNNNSLAVDSSGDMNLADGSVFIDRSTNNMGVGTSTPQEALHLKTQGGNIMLEGGTGTPYSKWQIATLSGGDFWIKDVLGTSTTPFYIHADAPDNSIRIGTAGVGIGTSAPESALHVTGSGTRLLVQDTVVGGSQVLMELEKNGVPAFRLTNTGLGSSWDFTQTSGGRFSISRAGSGQLEVQVTPTGSMIVAGSVIANGVTLTSSRNSKTDITDINTADIMEKLKKVEVAEWRYKEAAKNDRHISPMAEDFYSLFQLGPDNKGINPNDLASVAIIAAKELQKNSEQAKLETMALKKENAALKERLTSLEKLVTKLASGGGVIPFEGKKVSLNK